MLPVRPLSIRSANSNSSNVNFQSASSRTTRRLALCLAAVFPLLATILGAGAALAQDNGTRAGPQAGGMDTHLFRPAVDSKGFVTVNGTDVLGANNLSFGLVLDYGRHLLRTANPTQAIGDDGEPCTRGACDGSTSEFPENGGQGVPALIDDSFQGTFSFNYGVGNSFVLGVQVPVVLMTGDPAYGIGESPELGGTNYNTLALDQESIGRLALHGKWRITRVQNTIGLALLTEVGIPLGDAPSNLGGDPAFYYWPQLAAEHRFGSTGVVRLGLNAGYRGHFGENAGFGSDTLAEGAVRHGDLGTFGGALAWRAFDGVELVGETYGTYLLDDESDAKQKLSQELAGGIKLFIEKNSYFVMGAGHRTFSTGYQASDLRLFLGFIFEPKVGDTDGDGYFDDEDECPLEPEDFDRFEDEDGCPDPDNDQDGILDVDDRCPNTPEDKDGDEDEDGCPEVNDGDRDGDGIPDSRDKCPDQPEDIDGFEDEDGCPDPDNDKDGILDVDDECPLDPEDKDGFEDKDGCPDPDNDRDGILDVDDKCPNDPETYNGHEDEDGCPDKGRVIVDGSDILILDKIQFATNSAEILEASYPILAAVTSTLKHHPEFKVIEIAGHADERASDEHNLRLTKARAASVVDALVQRGIDRERLVSQGYGEYCPLDDRSTDAAWEKNRRVEFKVVRTFDGATGAPRGCDRARSKGIIPPPANATDY
jgi:OmpA-OmpF porin, OOP family